jgi:hypothetical protein
MLFPALALVLASAPCLSQNAPIAKTANERYAKLDVNHDGVLSRYEMDAEVIMGVLDMDGDGRSPPRSSSPCSARRPTTSSRWTASAWPIRTADDKLNVDEIERAANMRFDWLDADHDGNVSESELQARFLQPMVSVPTR